MYTGIIYKYISPSNKIYIGQTFREANRRYEHLSSSYSKKNRGYNTLFHKAIRKYGIDSFIYSVEKQLVAKTKEDLKILLDYWEQYYIPLYNCKVPLGYNCTDGGEGGTGQAISFETRRKMSISHIGHTVSNETKQKMSSWQIGKRLSEETKEKNLQFTQRKRKVL